MPRLKPATQIARREHILDAAERCFARAGFHRTTMQDICREADVSAGALYVYFDSKETLIAGLAERDREQFRDRFRALAAAPDVIQSLGEIAAQYFADDPAHKRLLCIEIGVEATRSPRVAEIFHAVDDEVRDSFRTLFQRLAEERRIDPVMAIDDVVEQFMLIGDGLFWRRAVIPGFDARALLPRTLAVIALLLRPVPSNPTPPSSE